MHSTYILPRIPTTVSWNHSPVPHKPILLGTGIPNFHAEWYEHLPWKTSWQNLVEIRDAANFDGNVEDMTLSQVTNGLWNYLKALYLYEMETSQGHHWSEGQCIQIAISLVQDYNTLYAMPAGRSMRAMQDIQDNNFEAKMDYDFQYPQPTPLPRPVNWFMAFQSLGVRMLMKSIGVESRYLPLREGVLHFFDLPGSEKMPPIVLLHGMFTTSSSVSPLAILLAASGRRVILPDLLSFEHGFSHAKNIIGFHRHVESIVSLIGMFGQPVDLGKASTK